MTLVFIDMLGVRDKWAKNGRLGAEDAFIRFRNLIAHSLHSIPHTEILNGIIESDSVIVKFATTSSALYFAKKIYVDAFNQTKHNENNRIWLRGVIIPQKGQDLMRWEKSLNKPYDHVKLFLYNDDLFDAIALEKSGIKGMRLLVDNELISEEIRKEWIIKVGQFNFITLKKLRNSSYPTQLNNKYSDFLWMANPNEVDNLELERIMALRLRKAANSSEEFFQAAATQLLFYEYSAMLGTLQKKLYFQTQKKLKLLKKK